MGNIGRGIIVALEQADKSIKEGLASEVMVVIISHGKAHGLVTGTSGCTSDELCNVELMDAASALALRMSGEQSSGVKYSSVVIDTDKHKNLVGEYVDEGARLAAVCGAKYFHSPDLSDDEILR